jgi:hypothetical protein
MPARWQRFLAAARGIGDDPLASVCTLGFIRFATDWPDDG